MVWGLCLLVWPKSKFWLMLLELFVTFVYGLSGYSALCTNQSNGCTYMRKQRQRHFGGKNALLTHRGHPCLSLSKLCLHIPQELKRAEQLWYMVWAALLKKERTHFHLYTRERTVGKKYVCPSRITVLKAFLLPCWKWPYHAGILEL